MSEAVAQVDMRELAEQIVRGLSHATVMNDRAFIRTCVLFPSGSTVVVSIEAEGGGRYRVSDLGQGSGEADRLDIGTMYRSQAKEIAKLSGIDFLEDVFVVTRIEAGQLPGATMAVANAVGRALDRALKRTEAKRRDTAADRLVTRLRGLFPGDAVTRDVDLRGASTHAWQVDAVVEVDGRQAVFDVVTSHQTSIAFATTKFHDLARLEDAPARIAVVHRKEEFREFLTVVSQAASVVEEDAGDRAYRRAAMLTRIGF